MVMESMPYPAAVEVPAVTPIADATQGTSACWRSSLPVLSDGRVTLRPLQPADATALFTMLTTEEVTRFISPPPAELGGFEQFIQWSQRECKAGRFAAFAIVPAGYDVAIGLVQVRQLDQSFTLAEWGIALGSPFWGTGLFEAATRLFFDFVFEGIGVHRLEGRVVVQNGRANGALRKIGGVQEGLLRRSLTCNGRQFDQLLWSILADDWREARADLKPRVH
jgi:ribosomal-protein-alanine N-acetyltransferase